ncbi:MAG TPA: ATP-binding protein, partial [Acidimicrobiales bacterium]
LAAADAAGLQLERAPIELGDVASDVVDAVAGVVSERNLSITTRLDPAPAEADERRIHQIVTNLVANAVRYSPPDASITIETGCFSDGDVFVRVTDSGPGLTDDDLEHVFDRFYRGSAAQGTEGSGVGLAIAAELAAAHGGHLTADHAAGRGARFTLTLPPGAH